MNEKPIVNFKSNIPEYQVTHINDLMIKITTEAADKRTSLIEEHIKFITRKPKWMPEKFFRFIISKVIVMELWQPAEHNHTKE